VNLSTPSPPQVQHSPVVERKCRGRYLRDENDGSLTTPCRTLRVSLARAFADVDLRSPSPTARRRNPALMAFVPADDEAIDRGLHLRSDRRAVAGL
jgi:hypothetical protein